MEREGRGEQPRADLLKRLDAPDSLPALSPVALKLVELASDEDCSVADLSNLVRKDPSLAVRLLKLANSAFFQTGRPVTSLEQAVVKVGFHRLRLMALSLSLRDTFPMGRVGRLDYERFWRSSLYRASLAKSLARRLKKCDPEEAFLAGLILEIGVLILFGATPGEEREWPGNASSLEETLAWETREYGLDHRRIGERVLKIWRFPDPITACQTLYGAPARTPGAPPLAWVSDLARELTERLFQGAQDLSALLQEMPARAGLGPEVLNEILADIFDQVQEVADQLRLEVDREKDLLTLMEKANRSLSEISQRVSGLPAFETLGGDRTVVDHTLQAVAHEIRNPLLAVGGFAKRLAASLDPSSDGGRYAKIILDEALRLEKALSTMSGSGGVNTEGA